MQLKIAFLQSLTACTLMLITAVMLLFLIFYYSGCTLKKKISPLWILLAEILLFLPQPSHKSRYNECKTAVCWGFSTQFLTKGKLLLFQQKHIQKMHTKSNSTHLWASSATYFPWGNFLRLDQARAPCILA